MQNLNHRSLGRQGFIVDMGIALVALAFSDHLLNNIVKPGAVPRI